MSTTGQPTTFSELYTDLLNRMRADTTASGMAETLAKRYLNISLHDIHIQQNWPWAERHGTIITRPPYNTGSISIAAATRTTLTGTNTLWNTAVTGMGFNNFNSGGKVVLAGEEEVYKVSAISSDTSATIASRYTQALTTASAYAAAYSNYTYYEDEYTLAADFFRLVDARQFSDVMQIECLGSQDFYQRFPRNSSRSGAPRKCTIIELGPDGTTADWQPRVVFHPYPDDAHTIPYRYITRYLAMSSAGVAQVELSADSDEPIIPKRYRHILLSYAASIWYRDQKDDTRSQEAYQEYVDGVKRIAGDSAPQRDFPSIRPRRMRAQPFFSRAASSRFTTGTQWDEMRE